MPSRSYNDLVFHLFTGTFRSLEPCLLQQVADAKRADPLAGLLIVCPSGFIRTRLQKSLGGAYLNIHFLGLHDLAEMLLTDGPLQSETIVHEPALFEELIRDELEGRGSLPPALRQDFQADERPLSQGLPAALAATVKDLRDSGARVIDAAEAARSGLLGPEAPETALALSLNALTYKRLKDAGLRTSADFYRRAAAHASASRWLQHLKAVWIYGFYDATGVQLDLLLSLAGHGNTRWLFPSDEKHPAYAFAEKLAADPVLLTKVSERTVSEEPARASAVDIVSCSGASDEIWWTAKTILRLADEGIPFNEIGVVARRLDPYFDAIHDIFASHAIPFAFGKTEPAGSHPPFKALRALLLENRGDPEKVATWGEHIEEAKARLETADEGIRQILESLSMLGLVLPAIPRKRFLDCLARKLGAMRRPPPDNKPAGVEILEVQQARGLHFRVLFLLGLNEKIFPRLIREDPFLPDNARSRLAQALGCRLGRKMDGYQEEKLLFQMMRDAATDHLYTLYQRSDEEGRALVPSIYIQELKREGIRETRVPRAFPEKIQLECGGPMLHATPALTPKELSVAYHRRGGEVGALIQAMGWPETIYDRLMANQQRTESFHPAQLPQDGYIDDLQLLRRYLRDFTPTSLEDLAQCPYRFFAGHVLRLQTSDSSVEAGAPSRLGLGRLFHRSLELYFQPEHQELALDEDQLRKACDRAADEFGREYPEALPLALESSNTFVFQHLLKYLKSDLEECLGSGFKPALFEVEVEGGLHDAKPLGSESFRGRIDRLDLRKTGSGWEARIVEYKSGKEPKSVKLETALIRGRHPQLAIYMRLAKSLLKKQGYDSVEINSASLRWVREEDADFEKLSLSEAFWQGPDGPVFLDNLAGWISLARQGHFFIEVNTGDYGYCARCDFARICRKEHMPTRFRAERDPVRLANLARMERTAARK